MGGQFADLLSDSELDELRAEGVTRRHRRGSTVLREGAAGDTVVLLESGRVKVTATQEDGIEVILALRSPGDLVGELAAIDGLPRSGSAIALDDVVAIALPVDRFRAYLEAHPRAMFGLVEMLVARLRDADVKRQELAATKVVGRLVRRIVELADEQGGGTTDGPLELAIGLSQDEMASLAGASREAVARGLRRLRDEGLIETKRRGITVLDLEALRERS